MRSWRYKRDIDRHSDKASELESQRRDREKSASRDTGIGMMAGQRSSKR